MLMNVHQFRDKHKDERVFLVGNGPSLNKTPLDELQGEHTIAMNRIALLYDRLQWRPTYYICTTINIERLEWRKDILATISTGIPSFVWEELGEHVQPYENVVYLHCTHGKEVTRHAPDDWWSYDIAERVCKFGTSILVALQVAVYMGFNPIYLLGCDLGFRSPSAFEGGGLLGKMLMQVGLKTRDPNHFSPSYGTPGLAPDILNYNMLSAHELALRATKKIGVQVFNATVGGQLEVYPRVHLKQLLEQGATSLG